MGLMGEDAVSVHVSVSHMAVWDIPTPYRR